MITHLVFDIDGTLIDHSYELDQKTTQGIIQLQEEGYTVILSSGRGFKRIETYAEQLRIAEFGGYVFESNGSAIVNMSTNQRTRIGSINQEGMNLVLDLVKDYFVEVHFYVSEGLYYYLSPEVYQRKKSLAKVLGLSDDVPFIGGVHEDFRDMRDSYSLIEMITGVDDLPEDIIKVSIFVRGSSTQNLFDEAKLKLRGFEIVRTSQNLIEITQGNVNKGNCLEIFMDVKNLDKSQVVSFGDGENDISMFAKTEISVAMETAQPYVKEMASHLTDSASNQGVLKALKRLEILK